MSGLQRRDRVALLVEQAARVERISVCRTVLKRGLWSLTAGRTVEPEDDDTAGRDVVARGRRSDRGGVVRIRTLVRRDVRRDLPNGHVLVRVGAAGVRARAEV